VTAGVAPGRPRTRTTPWRNWCLGAAALVAVVALVPPLGTVARRTEYAAALQFSLLAIALPALVTLGAPWSLLGLAGPPHRDGRPRLVDKLADRRLRHRELPWSIGFIALDLLVAAIWHAPRVVASVSSHPWLAVVEAAILLVLGVGLWLELISSPPLAPRSGHLRRAVLAAITMWVFWILAYLVGLSNRGFYPSFHHVAGGLSAAADEEIAAVVLWFVATAAFIPVIFWNAMTWLQSEEDPDSELLQVARAERRRGTAPDLGPGDAPSPGL
jgi:cytochrome c oxidase assembly factor CtaG